MKEDMIYRQNAIDVICLSWCGCQNSDCKHHFDPEVDESYWCDGCGDVEELKNMPSAQPERKTERWIPCSERLPKINEYVLAVFDHKNGVIDSIPLVSCYRPDVVDTTELNENGEWVVTSRKNPFATIDGWYIREITDAPDGSLFRRWNCVAWRPLPEAYEGGTEDGANDL